MKNILLIALVAAVGLLGFVLWRKLNQAPEPPVKPSVRRAQTAVPMPAAIVQRINDAKATGAGLTTSTKPLFV